MKIMNYILPLFTLLFSGHLLNAQEYKVTVENPKEAKLTLTDFLEEIPIEGYAGNEIIITSSADRFETPERAKGLKPVFSGGTDNTGIGLSAEKSGNQISIRCLLPYSRGGKIYKIKVPESLAILIKSTCERNNSVNIQNIKNEIEINVCQSISLKNVTGPLVLSNINGNIMVTLTELNKDKPISIACVNGDIDITLPAKSPVNIAMSTTTGNMYSDFDFPVSSKQMQRVGGNRINTQLNGGGTDVKLTTVNGNIFLRKG